MLPEAHLRHYKVPQALHLQGLTPPLSQFAPRLILFLLKPVLYSMNLTSQKAIFKHALEPNYITKTVPYVYMVTSFKLFVNLFQ